MSIVGYKNKSKEINVKSLILTFILIYITDAAIAMRTTSPLLQTARNVFFLGGALVSIFLLFIKRKGKLKRVEFAWLAIMCMCTLVSGLLNGENLNGLAMYIAKYMLLFGICVNYSYKDFCKNYIVVMRVICIVSLLAYLISQANSGFAYSLPTLTTQSSRAGTYLEWGTLLFTNLPINSAVTWTSRNFGPFWEPGAFAVHINLALYLVLFEAKDSRSKFLDILILLFTLATTLSSGGIIAGCILLVAYILSSENSKKAQWIKISVVVIAALATYYLLNVNKFFLSLVEERFGSQNGSFDSRWYSIIGNIYVFITHFFFGAGITGVDTALSQFYSTYVQGAVSTLHNTNTLFIYFSSIGVFAGIIQWMAWIETIWNPHKRIISAVLFGFIFMMLANEDMSGSMIFILFPLYALFNRNDMEVTE